MLRFAGTANRAIHFGVLHRRIVVKIQLATWFGADENGIVGGGPLLGAERLDRLSAWFAGCIVASDRKRALR